MNDDTHRELRRLVDEALPPPAEVPREDMWAGIRSRLESEESGEGQPDLPVPRPAALGVWPVRGGLLAAGVALLALGFGLGWWASPQLPGPSGEEPGQMVEDPGEARQHPADPAALAFALAHLSEVDLLLEVFQEEGAEEWVRRSTAGWAEDLLRETRVLLRLHRHSDPELALLLDDLELILIQVARLDETLREDRRWEREEVRLIAEALQDGGLRPRIRSFVVEQAPSQ